MENKCEILSLYITNELDEHEKNQFEHHLKTCIHCQYEIDSLQNAWQTLAYDLEETDVPESLKTDVMDFIFKENNELPVKKQHFLERLKLILAKQFSPLTAGITFILIIMLIGLSWNNNQLKSTISALENKEVSPDQVVKIYNLKGEDLASSANGIAYLLQKGHETNLVITLNSMPQTNGKEVYQVWLLKNGIRQNAGTLKPDQNGNGLLSYRLPKDYLFDGIGITLEQTPNHTQPKGQKVMGTS
ncbi:hypothetical protein BIV60_03290 [Bacillus sp. MUM 116]|uniref:anti-sigma factor n=1 Tax=Bacillus sp. MUM 116 TaxID=1678002 RepID=UPI0008F5EE7B|nr:anti-sigma factor [Bacillus sp. MUM 116]OIK16662.1 hypothetical protein BIV60_03290 [Bacillus sp. MUM 116]